MSYIVTRTNQKHEGGTKFYEMSLVHNTANNRTLLVKRYGKVGQPGQFKIEHFETLSQGSAEFNKTLEHRRKRDYKEPTRQDDNCKDWNEVANRALSSATEYHLRISSPEHIDFIKGGSGMSADVTIMDEVVEAKEEKETKPQLPDIPDWASW